MGCFKKYRSGIVPYLLSYNLERTLPYHFQIKGSLEQPYGKNLNQFEVKLKLNLYLRCLGLHALTVHVIVTFRTQAPISDCIQVFCSIFPFHFWFHKGMF